MSFGLIAFDGESLWGTGAARPDAAQRAELLADFAGVARGRLWGPPPIWRCAPNSARVYLGEVPASLVWRAAPPPPPAPAAGGGAREPGAGGTSGGRRAGARLGRAALSYKLYCDALTTTDGPCQTFPRLAVLSTFGRTMGPERGTRPAACNRICARSWAPAVYLIPGNQSPLGVSDLL